MNRQVQTLIICIVNSNGKKVETNDVFSARTLALYEGTQKILVVAGLYDSFTFWRSSCTYSRFRCGAFYLHSFLVAVGLFAMRILGLSAFYHDSAASIIEDGSVLAAAQEERFTRKKHDSAFPTNAVQFCLDSVGTNFGDIDYVAFYDKPFLKFERLLETYLAYAPRGFRNFSAALPIWIKEKLFQKSLLKKKLRSMVPDFNWEERLLFSEHHLSHAASAFFPSPYDEASVLTMDGVGEWTTTSVAYGRGSHLAISKEIHFPHSLGLLYSAFTYYTGFKINSGEYKLMGLAPYGEPRYTKTILDNLLDLKEDGSFRLNLSYFDYCTGLRMTNDKFARLFGRPARNPESKLTQQDMDLAASIQAVTEEIILRLTRAIAAEGASRNLCLAGGVALNCVANGKIVRDLAFENVWVQPAAGDAGGSLGAALAAYHGFLDYERNVSSGTDGMHGSYLGPRYDQRDIENRLNDAGARFVLLSDVEVVDSTAAALTEGKSVGWFQGRMEFGPRSLGNRSILGDPRSPNMQRELNMRVKFRESFRPFAPSILREHVSEWFDFDRDSPYMLMVADVKSDRRVAMSLEQAELFGIEKLNVVRSQIPAVTHVDFSARIQTVHADTNELFHALITSFYKRTGCPVLVNTSFNIRGEPIVCTPEDAFRCFMGTEIEVLVIGNCFLTKEGQSQSLKKDYRINFSLD